ncbi:FtsX-like permease family protein [Chryseolinea sp. T2]|uniref:FtsX-like permease family protein n=1 Tax=Chryseolinea sp. T2 TaxID=3129255 RepID=UPI003076C879
MPPKLFLSFFRWYCHPRLADHIEGDLLEDYGNRLKMSGRRKADFRFIIDVLLLFRPGIIRSIEGGRNLNHYDMYKSYFVIGWRNLLRNKAFSSINISGLALGMACSLLITLWVLDEKGMDAFHENNDNLFVVFHRGYHDGLIDGGYANPALLAEETKAIYPEVKLATSLSLTQLTAFEANSKTMKEMGSFASPEFFSVFSFPLLAGTKESALKTTSDIAISRKMAEDFFGSVDAAYGKSIRYQNRKDLRITAVFENLPSNTSMKFDCLINWQTFMDENDWAKNWGNNCALTYVVLHPGTAVSSFENKFQNFFDRHEEAQSETYKVKLGLQKYSDQYLHSQMENGEFVGGRIQYVNLFSIIAVFIVLIACINSMNLTTAYSLKRSREIGVRKVVGAFKSALVNQFIGEAILTTLLSFAVGLIIVVSILPVFNSITQKYIQIPVGQPYFWISIVTTAVLIGCICGSYPAFYQSAFSPIKALRGVLRFGNSALWFRRGLVVFQFVLSIMLITGTIVVSKQVGYVQNVNLGYDRENLIYIPLEGDLGAKYEVFKDLSEDINGVKSISRATEKPTRINNGTGGVEWEGKGPGSFLEFTQVAVGYDFIETMGMEMDQGRDLSPEFKSDSVGYIVNQEALKLINYDDPIGKPLTLWGTHGSIVGVVKDFHFNSLHTNIGPLLLRLGEEGAGGWAIIRVEAGKTKETLAGLEKISKELNPKFPFTYQFSDEEYQKLYASEQVVSKLSNAFAFLAIVISCLGLLGLTMFTTEKRTKEIGIRKTLGAPLVSLFNLLSKELFILIFIAIVIATPLAWYVMNDWLQAYAYKIEITIWIFIYAGMLAVLIALVTIGFQTMKASLMNPVRSLRSE